MRYFERERIIKSHLLKRTYRLLNIRNQRIQYNMVMPNRNNFPKEEILTSLPLPLAEAKLARLMDESGAFPNGEKKPYYGTLRKSYGYNKVIGYISQNNKVRTRIDYDPGKGYHFNFEDSRTKPARKTCIPISDMNENGYKHYIDMLTKKYEPYYNNCFKQNRALIDSLRLLYNYDFLLKIDPNENIKSDTFELIYGIEKLIQDKKIKKNNRIILNNYLNRDEYNSSMTRFKTYIKKSNTLIAPHMIRIFPGKKNKIIVNLKKNI